MHEDAERVSPQPQIRIECAEPGAKHPVIVGVYYPVESAGPLGREPDQAVQVVVAADDAVEGDYVCRLDVPGDFNEVAVVVAHSVRMALPLGLLPRRLDIRR